MAPEIVLAHQFVEYVPEELEERTLYVSVTYATAVHKCCCGCGREVVTPLAPTAWKLMFDGKSVSLHPSVGSWSLPCRSHYFITRNKVVWASQWTPEQVARGRAQEARARDDYFNNVQSPAGQGRAPSVKLPVDENPRVSLWKRVKRWFS